MPFSRLLSARRFNPLCVFALGFGRTRRAMRALAVAWVGWPTLLCLLVLARPAMAQTAVSGSISSSAHWTAAEGPYVLSGNVTLQNGATLTIDPGVTVYMGADASLTVQAGGVQALGTAANPIRILSDKTRLGQAAAAGHWFQWVFGPGTLNTKLEHVEFAHGSGLVVQGSSPVFNYLLVRDQHGPAITVDLAASPTGVGNQATGNTLNGVAIPSGDITGSVRWGLRGIPYVVGSGLVSVGTSPAIQSVTPNSVEQGQTVGLRINGTRLNGAVGSFDRVGLMLAPTGSSSNEADFQLTVAADAPPGSAGLKLQTDAGEVGFANALTVNPMTPVLTAISPDTILAGAGSLTIAFTGRNFLAGSEALFSAASVPTQIVSSGELRATLPNQTATGALQAQVRFPDPLNPGQYRLSNALTFTVNAPVPPSLAVEPTPIALPPDNKPHAITVRLSKPDYRDNTLSFSISDTAKATVSPNSLTIPVGQTTGQITIQPLQTGTVSLSVSSSTLQGLNVPLFITADFRGASTAYSPSVGVVVESASSPGSRSYPAASTNVGVAVGPILTDVSPIAWMLGDSPVLTVFGTGLAAGAQVAVQPSTGIGTGPATVSEDGRQLQFSLSIAPDAALGPRQLKVKDANGKDLFFADPAKAVVQVVAGMPAIDSIAPVLTTPGTQVNLTVRGRNLQQGMLSLTPATGINIDTQPQISVDGTTLTDLVDIAPNAPVGSRLVQVATPAGSSTGSFTPANTFTVAVSLGSAITPIASPLVGVAVGDNTPPPVARQYPLASPTVGVLLGTAIDGVSPNSGVVGSTISITLHGMGLQNINSLALLPATGLAVSGLQANAEGTELTFNLQIDPAAALGYRRLVVYTDNGPVSFLQATANQFLISAPVPVLDSVAPQVLLAGQPTATLTLQGRNLLNISAVRIEPPQNVSVNGPFVTNADGTSLGFAATVETGAASGPRTVIVTSVAGDSDATQKPGNSIRIANQVGSTYASISSPVVGVAMGDSTPLSASVSYPLASSVVGVTVESPPVPVSAARTVASPKVGLNVGAIAQRISPDGWLQGSSGTISVTGVGLDSVASAQALPSTGITLGTPVSSEEGGQLSVPISVAADAPLIYRRLRLYTAGNAELVWQDPAAPAFGIGMMPTLTSVSPIYFEQGKTATLSVRGGNLKGVIGVAFEPSGGLVAAGPVAWTQDAYGELLTVPVSVDAAAPLVDRVVRLLVPGGGTSSGATPANTIKVVIPQ